MAVAYPEVGRIATRFGRNDYTRERSTVMDLYAEQAEAIARGGRLRVVRGLAEAAKAARKRARRNPAWTPLALTSAESAETLPPPEAADTTGIPLWSAVRPAGTEEGPIPF